MRHLVIAAILFSSGLANLHAAPEWTVLENCRLIQNPANDADSFHVSVGDKEYLLRLYLVDAPEIEARTPSRLIEQAKYFEITVPQAIEVGEAAKEFTKARLAEPFKAFTRMTDAMGSSKIERVSAFVQTKGGDLGEQLVRNGLARVHGIKGAPPGFKTSKAEVERLRQLETEAREEKIGGWGINDGRLHVRPATSPAYSFFVSQEQSPPRKITSGKLDINTATENELEALPGIGPIMAGRIIAARPFDGADNLRKVNGIGDKMYAKIRPYFR
jgi:DNA uptake protein ComE-like DNA-binding protein